MLLSVRNRLLTTLKMAARTTSPRTEGNAPGSPERSLNMYPRTASAMPRRSMSREKPLGRSAAPRALGDAGGTAVTGGRWPLLARVTGGSVVRSVMSDSFVGGRRGQAEVSAAAAGHEF